MIRYRWFCRCRLWQVFTWACRWRLFDGWNCMNVTRAVGDCCNKRNRTCTQCPAFPLSSCSSSIFFDLPILKPIPFWLVTIPSLIPFFHSWTRTSSVCRHFPFSTNRSWVGYKWERIFWITLNNTYGSRNRGLWRLRNRRRTCRKCTLRVRIGQEAFGRCSFKKLFD